MNYPIDLGKKMPSPMMPMTSKDSEDDMHYPSLYLEWDKDYELPDEGVMEVRFKKRSETNRKNGDGMSQMVELDITQIIEVESEDEEEGEENGSDSLDKYKEESDELEMGTKVEMEHTDDPKEARKIAMDHLKEEPRYYTKLKQVMNGE